MNPEAKQKETVLTSFESFVWIVYTREKVRKMNKSVSPRNSPRKFDESQEDSGEDYRGVERLLTRLRRALRTDNHFFQLFLGKKHRKLLSFGDLRRGLANIGIFPKLAYLYAVFELLDHDKDGRFTTADLTRVFLETSSSPTYEISRNEEEEEDNDEEEEYNEERIRDASMTAARVALSAAASSTKNVILSTAYVEIEEDEIEVEDEEIDDDFVIHSLKLASWITLEESRRLIGITANNVLHYRSVLEEYFDNTEYGTMSRKSFDRGFVRARELSNMISSTGKNKNQQDIDRMCYCCSSARSAKISIKSLQHQRRFEHRYESCTQNSFRCCGF